MAIIKVIAKPKENVEVVRQPGETVATYLMRGEKGEQGIQGPQGLPGVNGTNGTNGVNGQDGADGASAYEVAVANGFVGSETAWLASLKGAKGDTGATGATGAQGPKGDTGDTGPGVVVGGTAGQILAKIDSTNYNTEWIDNYTSQVKHLVKNSSGSTMNKGSVVYISGSSGTNMLVSLADADSDLTSATTIGLLESTLINNAQGFVITEGLISGLDTSTATIGDPVWLSSTAGQMVFGLANKPVAPVHLVYLGTVTRVSATVGEIFIRVNNGWELDELHNVQATTPNDGDLLKYDNASSLWKNASQSSLTIAQSQVTGLTTDLAAKAALTADQTFTGTQTLIPSAIANQALIIQGASGQTQNIIEVRNTSGTMISRFTANANFATDGQTYVGSGSASISNSRLNVATGSASVIGAVVRGAASQSAALTEWQNNSASVLAQVTSSGTFGAAENIIAGSTSGAIGRLTSYTGSAGIIGAVIRGAASQTADLTQWQNSSGTVLGLVASTGSIRTTGHIQVGSTTYVDGIIYAGIASAATKGVVVRGAASQTADLAQWQDSSGNVLARFNSSGQVGTSRLSVSPNASVSADSRFFAAASSATDIVALVRGAASQSADLMQFQNSAGSVIAKVDAFGGYRGSYLQILTGSTTTVAAYLQGNANNLADLIQYRNSGGTSLGGRNANAQIYSGSTAPLTTAVGGATTAASGTGTTATITTSSNHNLAVGDRITVAGVTPTGYNGTYIVTAVTANTVSYANATTGSQTIAGTVSVDAQASVTARSAGTAGLIVRAATSQTTDVVQYQNNVGSVMATVGFDGRITTTSGVSATSWLRVGSATAALGGGSGIVAMANATTVPTSNPTGGGILYAEGGALKWRGSSGTVTTIANA